MACQTKQVNPLWMPFAQKHRTRLYWHLSEGRWYACPHLSYAKWVTDLCVLNA
jgi:hypothetical protein